MALAGRSAFLKITSAAPVSSTDVACTATTGLGGSVQVTSTALRHWDPASTPSLYRVAAGSTTLESSTKYTVNYVQGKFEYKADQTLSTGTYNADINYLTVSNIGGGREWQLNVEQEAFEVTEFGSSGWKQYQPNLNGATVQLSRYWQDSEFFDRLNTESLFLLELGVNSVNGWRYEGYGYVTSDQINTSVDSLVNETVSVNVSGQLYYSTG